MSDFLQPHGLQHARPPCPSPTPGIYPNSRPLSQWCHPTISSSAVPFSSHLFHQVAKILVSASASVPPMNIQDWFPLGWTGLISLQSKGLSRVISNNTHSSKASILQHSAFFMVQLSHAYMTTGKTIALTRQAFVGKCLCFLICSLGWS